jgi:hypothetical protein
MKTILAATLLALSATSVAAQTTFYGPGGDYLGQGARHRNTTTFYYASGSFVGSSVTIGRSTSFFGRDGSFQGTLTRTGDATNFYDRAGRYQGSVTTMPPPLGDKRWPRRLAGGWRHRRPYLQVAGRAAGSPLDVGERS